MEEMNELFYRNPYQTTFQAHVVSCSKQEERYAVVLEDTLFYPEGGGQPCDLGTIENSSVLDVQREQGQIVHYCDQPLEIGKEVQGQIDWNRRFDFMQQHSGEHIVSGLVHAVFGYENVGFHMGEVIQIDFDGMMSERQAEEIFEKANDIIQQNVAIHVSFPSEEQLRNIPYRSKKELQGKVRIVSIENADICACCGTHVSTTGEIGLITMLSIKKHKKGVRIEMLCGKRAYRYLKGIQKENAAISHMLSAEPVKTSQSVSDLIQKYQSLMAEMRTMQYQQVEKTIQEMKPDDVMLLFTQHLDRKQMTLAANTLHKMYNAKLSGICNEEENGYSYVLMSDCLPLKQLAAVWNQRCAGRGGGKDDMVQGTFLSQQSEIEKIIKESVYAKEI